MRSFLIVSAIKACLMLCNLCLTIIALSDIYGILSEFNSLWPEKGGRYGFKVEFIKAGNRFVIRFKDRFRGPMELKLH